MAFNSIPQANRFRFPPTKSQVRLLLSRCLGALRFAYNHALDLISTAWRERPERKTYVDANKEITDIKEIPSVENLWEAWEAAEAETERWLSAQYDGLLGDPPEWIPEQTRLRFHGFRSSLLAKYGETQARRWFVCRSHHGGGWVEFVPFDVRDKVDELVRIWRLAGLGKAEGLSAFLGEGMASALCAGRKASDGGRKGHEETYGTEEEKLAKWNAYQIEVDRQHELDPYLSYEVVCAKVAKRFGVCKKTIKRHTVNKINPRKK